MSYKQHLTVLLYCILILNWGCTRDITELDKYKTPPWIKGFLFTQLSGEKDLTIFIECLEKTGYDTILNISGSYTVFAPTNDAFQRFFLDHPEYSSIDDIPKGELEAIVEFQILPNAWSKEQLQTLDVTGWINEDDVLSKPRAFKRKTLLYEKNKSYPVKRIGNYYRIVELSESSGKKTVYTSYNKFCPIFFNEFFNINELNFNDYEFFFNRPFEPWKLYYAEAEIAEDIPAENGFIYKTDRVITPIPNGEQILIKGNNGYSYQKFLNLIYSFSEFNINLEATYEQPGADQGLAVDTLYNLSYPELIFNINSELTSSNNPGYTHSEHHGLLAPTDEALESFISLYLSQWGDYKDMPGKIKRLIINSYMTKKAVYQSDLTKGFLNGLNDSVIVNPDDIVQKVYGSNCSFIGLKEAIVPRVITSVCRPLYLSRQFETMMYACEDTRVISALKKTNSDFGFFLPPDSVIGPAGDSSLIRNFTNYELDQYYWVGVSQKDFRRKKTRDISEIRNQLLNQITETTPDGSADIEFLRTLGGNYIIYNNVDGTATGTSSSKFGYEGVMDINIYPKEYMDYSDNGKVYLVNGWFSFQRIVEFVGLFLSSYQEFMKLIEKAGLYDKINYDIPFLIDGEKYTVFIPTNQALEEYQADTLTVPELRDFIKYHFVKGELIFTDGKMPGGDYSTALLDESSTDYSSRYATLNLNPKPNKIEILDKNGNVYTEIKENGDKTNQMTMYDTNVEPWSTSSFDYIVTGVVHEVDRVFIKDLLQKK